MKILLLALLLIPASALQAAPPNPADYMLTVHVMCSFVRSQSDVNHSTLIQRLGVVLDGKQVELTAAIPFIEVLALGDYKARIVKDTNKYAPDIWQFYELLRPDGKVTRYQVSGLGPGTCSSGQ